MGLMLMNHGNLCITGHNYKGIFQNLRKMAVGDTFYLVSKDGRKITYQIQETLSGVNQYDMSHIEQNDDGIRRVTIITCDPRGLYEVYS